MKRLLIYSGVLVLIAAALVLLLTLDRPGPANPEEEWTPKPLVSKDAAINRLVVTEAGQTLIFTYQQEIDGYIMTADGKEFMTNRIMAERLMGTIVALERKKLISLDPPDLTLYGLNPPPLTISVEFDGAPPLELLVGKENYTHDALFAKEKDNPTVFLIPLDLSGFIGNTAKSYRSSSLIYAIPMSVASIEIKIDSPELLSSLQDALQPKLVVQKQVQGQRPEWIIVSPINESAVFTKVDDLFSMLRMPDTQDILDPKPEEMAGLGLNPPRATLTLTLFSGESQKILFGRQEGDNVYATNTSRPGVMLIRAFIMNDILMFSGRQESPVAEKREVLPTQVLVEYPREGLPSMQLDLVADNKSYTVAGSEGKVVLLSRVRRILKQFRDGQMIFFQHREPYSREKYGLDRPRMIIKMQEGENIPFEIAIGNVDTYQNMKITYIEDLRRKCVLAITGDIVTMIPYGEREFTTPPKVRQ